MAGMMMKIIFTFGVLVSLTSATSPLLSSSSSYYPLPYSHSRSSEERHEDTPYSQSLIPSYEPDETDYEDDFDCQVTQSICRSLYYDEFPNDESRPYGLLTSAQVVEVGSSEEGSWARGSPENNGPLSVNEVPGQLSAIPVAGFLLMLFPFRTYGNPSHSPTSGHHQMFGAHGSVGSHDDLTSGGHGGYFNAIGSVPGDNSPVETLYGDNPLWNARVQQRIHEANILRLKEDYAAEFYEPTKHDLRTAPVPGTGYPMFPPWSNTESNLFLGGAPLAHTPQNLIHETGDVVPSIGRPGLIYEHTPNSQIPTSNDAYVPLTPQPSPLLPPKPYLYGISDHIASSPSYQHYTNYEEERNDQSDEEERNDQSDNQDEKSVPATLEEAKRLTSVSQTDSCNDPISTVHEDESQKSTAVRIPDGNNNEVIIPVTEVDTEIVNDMNSLSRNDKENEI